MYAYMGFANCTYGDGTQDQGLLCIRILDNCSRASRDLYYITFQASVLLGRWIDGEFRVRVTGRGSDSASAERRAGKLSTKLVSGRAGAEVTRSEEDGTLPSERTPLPEFDGSTYTTFLPPHSLSDVFGASFFPDSEPLLPIPRVKPIPTDKLGIGESVAKWSPPAIPGLDGRRVLVDPDLFIAMGDPAHWMVLVEEFLYDHTRDVKQQQLVLQEDRARLAREAKQRATDAKQAKAGHEHATQAAPPACAVACPVWRRGIGEGDGGGIAGDRTAASSGSWRPRRSQTPFGFPGNMGTGRCGMAPVRGGVQGVRGGH
jgi:hypothetical protein